MSRRRHRVEWADAARKDLLGIVDYLLARNPDAAETTLNKLERRAESLKTTPGRGRVVPELELLQMRQYRELVVSPYRSICRISESSVLVLAVFDSRRNLEDVLLERLIGGR